MSIAFHTPDPPPPVHEQVYRRVREDTRTAEARVREVPGVGLELRVLVDDQLVWSQIYRGEQAFKFLGHMSEKCREDFQRLGWQSVSSS
jgi:hypothetical protein